MYASSIWHTHLEGALRHWQSVYPHAEHTHTHTHTHEGECTSALVTSHPNTDQLCRRGCYGNRWNGSAAIFCSTRRRKKKPLLSASVRSFSFPLWLLLYLALTSRVSVQISHSFSLTLSPFLSLSFSALYLQVTLSPPRLHSGSLPFWFLPVPKAELSRHADTSLCSLSHSL